MLEVFEPEPLNLSTVFHFTLETFSVSRNSISTHFPLSESLNTVLCNLKARTPCLAFFLLMTSGGVIIIARQVLFFSEPSAFSLSLLDPYCDHAGVNISLNNSSLLTFFNLMLLLFAHLQWKAKPIPFPFRSSLFPKFFYSGGISIAIAFLGLKRYFRLTWRGRI